MQFVVNKINDKKTLHKSTKKILYFNKIITLPLYNTLQHIHISI